MRFFKNGCNGGMRNNFYYKWEEVRNGVGCVCVCVCMCVCVCVCVCMYLCMCMYMWNRNSMPHMTKPGYASTETLQIN